MSIRISTFSLIGDDLPARNEFTKRKTVSTSKFYFFDIGVVRFLQNRQGLRKGSPEFGEAFEAYLYHELKSYCDFKGSLDLHYWRSKSGFEVDFIINCATAIEVKAKKNITSNDQKVLRALKE